MIQETAPFLTQTHSFVTLCIRMKKRFVLLVFLFLLITLKTTRLTYAGYTCNQSCALNPAGCDAPNTCVGGVCRNPDCTDQTDCSCDYPNCKNITPPTTLIQGDPATFSATFENYYGPVTSEGLVVYQTGCADEKYNQTQSNGPGTDTFTWTPTTSGTHTVYCRGINGATAECRGTCNNGQSSSPYACLGPGASLSVNVMTPTPYPTAAVSGNLKEYLKAACYSDISSDSVSVNLIPDNATGITVNCGVTPNPAPPKYGSYKCTVSFDNQTAQPTPIQNFTLMASGAGYSSPHWTDDNSCKDTPANTIGVNVKDPVPTNVFSKDIFFDNVDSWFKLKDSSFASNGNLTNPIPLNLSAYDADDDGSRNFVLGQAGVTTAGSIDVGTADVSTNKWKATSYAKQSNLTASNYYDYIKSRKTFVTVNQPSEIQKNKINVINGNQTITSDINTNAPFVLVVTNAAGDALGNVIIDMATFNAAGNSLAIIADTITFTATDTESRGVFIAKTIDTSNTVDQGLKIIGNVVAQSTMSNGRSWSNNSKPSVFIITQAKQYVDLLPYLSIDKYEQKILR